MNKTIPQHILEALNCGEEPVEKYYDIYGKENLEAALEALKKSDEEILAKYSSDDMFEQITAARMKNANLKAGKSSSSSVKPQFKITYQTWARFGGIAAALVVLFISVTNYAKINPVAKTPVADSAISDSETGVRQKGAAKGTPQLFVYRQNGSDAELLGDKARCVENDVLQLAFNANGSGYGLIFSVDGNGNLTTHYPSDGLKSALLDPAAGTTYLDYSYELDDAPNFEVFVMVTSDKSFNVDEDDLFLSKKSLRYLQEGRYLPEGTRFTTFTVKKSGK